MKLLKYFKIFFVIHMAYAFSIAAATSYVKTQVELKEYLQEHGYTVIALEPFAAKGATDCKYYILHSPTDRYFIKVGEKVDREIANLHFLSQNGVACIPRIFPGTSEQEKILVEEFFDFSDYGFQVINDFHDKKISLNEFLQFQKKSISLLQEFYQLEVTNNDQPSQVFIPRLTQRMKDLLADQDLLWMPSEMETRIYLRDLLHTPITYINGSESINYPSICELVEQFVSLFSKLPQMPKRILHGDFHAPNLLQDKHGFLRAVDLSDIMYREDPAWDLGKWLNHINRLHRVVKLRSTDINDSTITLTFSNRILLEDHRPSSLGLAKINQEAAMHFSNLINIPKDLVAVRAAAAEFVVNVSTLRRHMIRFPYSTKTVIWCIIDSFKAFQTQLHLYGQTHPECQYRDINATLHPKRDESKKALAVSGGLRSYDS